MKNELTPYEFLFLKMQKLGFPDTYNGYKILYLDNEKCNNCSYRQEQVLVEYSMAEAFGLTVSESACDNCERQCDIEYDGTLEDKIKVINSFFEKPKREEVEVEQERLF